VPPAGATVRCVNELGLVTPRNFSPTPGWLVVGHRIKNPLDYERAADKVWVYGALCGQQAGADRDGDVT